MFTIHPDKKLYLLFFTISLIFALLVLLVTSIADQQFTFDGIRISLIIFGILFFILGGFTTPYILSGSVTIKDDIITHTFWIKKESLAIKDIEMIEERWIRSRIRPAGKTMTMFIKTADKKLVINYKYYSEKDINELISILLKRNPHIINHFRN